MRVLVVDDDAGVRSVVRTALRPTEVLEAPSGPAALSVLAHEQVDVVLLDVMMPELSGYEVLLRIRRTGRHADVPVVMLTARTAETDYIKAYRTGADGYLTKPFDIDELVAAVDDVVDRPASQRNAVRERELGKAELLRQIEHQFG